MMTALVRNEIIKFQLHVDKHYLYPVPLYTRTISGIVIIRFAPKYMHSSLQYNGPKLTIQGYIR